MPRRLCSVMLLFLSIGPALAKGPGRKSEEEPVWIAQSLKPGARLLATAPEHADDRQESAKDAAIRKLLHLMGLKDISDQLMEAVIPQLRPVMLSAVPQGDREKFVDEFSRTFRARFSEDEIVNAEVPIYSSHFSLEEIKQLTQFYESPVGQRFVSALPEVSRESQAAATRIGRKVLLDTFHAMSGEYPALKNVMPTE
jgi:hypothetical protein